MESCRLEQTACIPSTAASVGGEAARPPAGGGKRREYTVNAFVQAQIELLKSPLLMTLSFEESDEVDFLLINAKISITYKKEEIIDHISG